MHGQGSTQESGGSDGSSSVRQMKHRRWLSPGGGAAGDVVAERLLALCMNAAASDREVGVDGMMSVWRRRVACGLPGSSGRLISEAAMRCWISWSLGKVWGRGRGETREWIGRGSDRVGGASTRIMSCRDRGDDDNEFLVDAGGWSIDGVDVWRNSTLA